MDSSGGFIIKTKLSQTIFEELKSDIIYGNLKPNERIVELEIAKRFNTSQAPVRESLQRLNELGLVDTFKYTGTVISAISNAEIIELFELRNLLEKLAVRNAMFVIKNEDLINLEQIVSNMFTAANHDDLRTLVKWDMEFHQTFINLSGKKITSQIWMLIDVHIRRFLMISHPIFFENLFEVANTHVILLDKIKTKNIEEIESAFENHLSLSWDKIRSRLGNI